METRIKTLLQRLEKEENIYDKIILSGLIEAYYNCFLSKEKKKEIKKDLKNCFFYNNIKYKTLSEDLNEHIKISDKVMEIFYNSEHDCTNLQIKENLSIKEVDEIVSEILKNISYESYINYKQLKENNRIIRKEIKNEDGFCINGMGYEQDFIIINNKINNIADLSLTLLHELGHTYENEIMKNQSKKAQVYKYKGNYTEVISRFFERVSMDYMIENNIYKEDNNIILNKHYSDLIYNFFCLDKLIYYIQNNLCVYDNEKYGIIKEINYTEIEDRFSALMPTIGNYRKYIDYGYGTLIGEYFYYIYKNNKKEGLLKIRNFISKEGILSNKQVLEEIKLLENDLSFFKPSIKNNIRQLKKI